MATDSSMDVAGWVAQQVDAEAAIRLIGAVLAEQHDEWAEARRYMSVETLAKIETETRRIDTPNTEMTTPEAIAA